MTHLRPARLQAAVAGFTVLTLVALAGPGAVLGHAELATASPADRSTIAGPPPEIALTFTENLDPARSSVRLVDSGGGVVAEGGTVEPGDPRTMRLALTADLAPGTYTVRWTSFSTEDNEQDRGTTTFTVTLTTAPPTVVPSAAPSAAPPPTALPSSPTAPSPSPSPASPTASSADVLIPIVAVLAVLVGLGLRLLRGRSRTGS